jgi:N-acetylglutamate synthase-like GNAT family acetyltransferase
LTGKRSLRVRVATRADAATVTDILTRSYASAFTGVYPDEHLTVFLPLISQASLRLLASGAYYIAESDEGAVGCGGWSAERPGSGERIPGLMHIRHFAVYPDAFGGGAGKALFRRCLTDAALLGFSRLEVYSSLNAEGFYAAMGCRGIAQEAITMPGGATMLVVKMERSI